jgi:hypothetical protein
MVLFASNPVEIQCQIGNFYWVLIFAPEFTPDELYTFLIDNLFLENL